MNAHDFSPNEANGCSGFRFAADSQSLQVVHYNPFPLFFARLMSIVVLDSLQKTQVGYRRSPARILKGDYFLNSSRTSRHMQKEWLPLLNGLLGADSIRNLFPIKALGNQPKFNICISKFCENIRSQDIR